MLMQAINLNPTVVGLKWFVLIIKLLYSMGMWFGEDSRANIVRSMFKRDKTTSSNNNNYFTLNNESQLRGPMYLIKKSTNMHFQ